MKHRTKLILITILFTLVALWPMDTLAHSSYCDGFYEGYRMVKGDFVTLPICPIEPTTPVGSTPFREGVKMGIKWAMREVA